METAAGSAVTGRAGPPELETPPRALFHLWNANQQEEFKVSHNYKMSGRVEINYANGVNMKDHFLRNDLDIG